MPRRLKWIELMTTSLATAQRYEWSSKMRVQWLSGLLVVVALVTIGAGIYLFPAPGGALKGTGADGLFSGGSGTCSSKSSSVSSDGTLLFDPTGDAAALISERLEQVGSKRLLILWGEESCPQCRQLADSMTAEPPVAEVATQGYEIVFIDAPGNPEKLQQFIGTVTDAQLPVLTVHDKDGKLLASHQAGNGTPETSLDLQPVVAFLKKWSP